jgi:hypothetical protein
VRKKTVKTNLRAGHVDKLWESGNETWVQQYAAEVLGMRTGPHMSACCPAGRKDPGAPCAIVPCMGC